MCSVVQIGKYMFQDPQWTPETENSTKPYIYYVFFFPYANEQLECTVWIYLRKEWLMPKSRVEQGSTWLDHAAQKYAQF